MDLEISKIKYAGSLFQFAGNRQFTEAFFYSIDQVCRNIELMVAGQDALCVKFPDSLYRLEKLLRISCRIKRIETAPIDQVPGIQIFSLRLIEAAVTGGVSGRMNDR